MDFFESDFMSFFVSSSSFGVDRSIAIFVADGLTSFEDCPLFTWLFGWIDLFARFAMISFAFMLYEVPAPAWMASNRKSVSNFPSENSFAAWIIAFPDCLLSSPSDVFASAAASLTRPSAFLNIAGALSPEIWKLFNALAVKAP